MSIITDTIDKIALKLSPSPLSLGVDAGSDSVKIALVKEDSQGLALLLDYEIIPLKNNTRPSGPASVITDALRNMKIPRSTQVKFVVSGPDVDLKRIRLSPMPKEEIAQALRWQSKEHFLFNIDESTLDFKILKQESADTRGQDVEVIASIAKNSIINNRLLTLRETDLSPSVITPAAYALCNFYRLSGIRPDYTTALIDIGAETTTIVIIRNNEVRFTRQLGYAGNDCTKAMSGALVSEQGSIEISQQEAERLKKEAGIPGKSDTNIRDNISSAQVHSMLRPVLEKLVNDIKLSFNYYANFPDAEPISAVYLTGGTSMMRNIDSELSKRISMPVGRLKAPEKLKLKLKKERAESIGEDFPFIAPAIGAALQDPEGMNLIPASYKNQKLKNLEMISMRLVFITVIILLSVFYLFNIGHEKTLLKVINAKKPECQKLRQAQELYSKITQANLMMNQTVKEQAPLYYIYKSLSNLVPREMYLRSLDITEYAGSMSMEGVIFESGQAAEVVLAGFIKELEDSAFFNHVLLDSAQDIMVSKKQAVEFKINCGLGKAE